MLLFTVLFSCIVATIELVGDGSQVFLREERLITVIQRLEKLDGSIRAAWPFFEGPTAQLGISMESVQMMHR